MLGSGWTYLTLGRTKESVDQYTGAIIFLEVDAPGGGRVSELVVTDGAGCFSKDVPIATTGEYQVQSFWHGDATHSSTSSLRIDVQAYDSGDVDCDDVPNNDDNCVNIPNPNQENVDQDAQGDLCDCNSQDSGAWILPPQVTNVRFLSDQLTLQWDSLGPVAGWSTLYDVTRGLTAEFPTGAGPSETCLALQTQGDSIQDELVPKVGEAQWYFVQPSNSCGYGTPGAGPDSVLRGTAACGVCPHDICTEGSALDPSCGTCAAEICAVDPFCCSDEWDSLCVGEVNSICGSSQCTGN